MNIQFLSNSMDSTTMSNISMIVMLVIMVVIMIVPQRKREKKVKQMLNSIKEGDRIRTIGGFYGRVCNVKDDILTIECGPDKVKVKLTISKGAVSTVDSADVENDKDVKLTPKDEAK